MQESGWTKAAQIRDDRPKAGGVQRADHAVPASRVIREAMQEDNGLPICLTAVFEGDLQSLS
jgi:hypothetical protein